MRNARYQWMGKYSSTAKTEEKRFFGYDVDPHFWQKRRLMIRRNGNHTWDLIIEYHRCPDCGYIIESREDYRYLFGKWVKDVSCERCGKHFKLTKVMNHTFGPLIGRPQPPEITWD